MSAHERVGQARFLRIMLEDGRPVFWLGGGDQDVGYIPLGSLVRNVNQFVCLRIRLRRQTYATENVVLVDFSKPGGRELAIERPIQPSHIWAGDRSEIRLRLGDYLKLADTFLGHQFNISTLPWHEKRKVFAQRPPHEVREAVTVLVGRIEFTGVFRADNLELQNILRQLSRPRYEGPAKPQKDSDVREWLISFVTWAITAKETWW